MSLLYELKKKNTVLSYQSHFPEAYLTCEIASNLLEVSIFLLTVVNTIYSMLLNKLLKNYVLKALVLSFYTLKIVCKYVTNCHVQIATRVLLRWEIINC